MKWMKRSGGLRKRLENVKHPGKRLKLIREARNSTQEFRGECGLRKLCTFLASKDCVGDDAHGRKIVSEIEAGARAMPSGMVDPWLEFLDATSKEAGLSVEEESVPAAEKPGEPAAEKRVRKPSKIDMKPTNKIVFVNHCEGDNLEVFVEQYAIDGSIHVHIFHDQPVPEQMLKDLRQGVRMGRAWVPGAFQKYANSDNPKDRQVVNPRKTVDLTK